MPESFETFRSMILVWRLSNSGFSLTM